MVVGIGSGNGGESVHFGAFYRMKHRNSPFSATVVSFDVKLQVVYFNSTVCCADIDLLKASCSRDPASCGLRARSIEDDEVFLPHFH